MRIGGEPVTHRTPLHRFLNGAEKRPLPVVLREPSGSERVIELRGISYQKARALDRQERETSAKRQVALSKPDVTYLFVPNMNRDTLQQLEVGIYQASLGSKGLILDFRNNGGGREADRMLNLFSQPAHSYTIPRDGPARLSGRPPAGPGMEWPAGGSRPIRTPIPTQRFSAMR